GCSGRAAAAGPGRGTRPRRGARPPPPPPPAVSAPARPPAPAGAATATRTSALLHRDDLGGTSLVAGDPVAQHAVDHPPLARGPQRVAGRERDHALVASAVGYPGVGASTSTCEGSTTWDRVTS